MMPRGYRNSSSKRVLRNTSQTVVRSVRAVRACKTGAKLGFGLGFIGLILEMMTSSSFIPLFEPSTFSYFELWFFLVVAGGILGLIVGFLA